jgi:hypothetical protein
MLASTARRTWRTLEPIHGLGYFAPETNAALEDLGFPPGGRAGYFASRAAPMGPVSAEVVIATFYNFNPELVHRAIPSSWSVASPADIFAARREATDLALRRILGDEAIASPEMEEAADLARQAASSAAGRPEGRPLFAAYVGLDWPTDPHLVLWHAQTLLREFRGDAHIAALMLAGLGGAEALVTHAASGDVPAAVLQSSRAWSDDQWAAAVDRLRSRGLVDADGAFTDAGRALRQAIEDRTDEASVGAYEVLGDEGCSRLRALARPWSKAIVAGGALG